MYQKSIKLRPVVSFVTDYNTSRNSEKKPNDLSPVKAPLKEKISVQSANMYDKKFLESKGVPTALEFVSDRDCNISGENQKINKDPKFQKAKSLALINEFLFEMSYTPFLGFIIKDFNGQSF